MFRFLFCILGLAGVLVMGGISSLHAQFARAPEEYGTGQYPVYGSAVSNQPDQDLAGDQQHGAARISIVQGDVNVRRGDTSELVAAAINAPLMAQDRLQTAGGSRAEIELDSANLIRLAPDTDVGLADAEYHRFQVQLGAGTIMYRVLRRSESQGEVDTPSIALRALGEGAFRVAVLEDGTTRIDVRAGMAEIFGPRGSQRIEAGHSVIVRGNPADPEFLEVEPLMRDQFDEWNETRDRELLPSQSYNYVSPDISGAEDLDTNGTWVPSQYGQVWAPRAVVPDWAPYSYGQWSWEPYYGWTWVDYAPWGWAPYHYGRWFWNGGYGWCWWPGARLSVHLWSPALVGFFGWRNGSVGWAALAPYERFQPWWRRGGWTGVRPYGPGGFDALRSGTVWSIYRNAAFRGGAVYAGYNGFGGPHQRFGFVAREQLGSASFIQGQVPVRPDRASYLFTSRQAVANPRLSSVSNLRFFQYRQLSSSGTGQRARASGWSRGGAAPNQGRYPDYPKYGQNGYPTRGGVSDSVRGSTNGWQRFGDPGSSNGYRQGLAQGFAGGSGESGWHQFGRPQQTYPSREAARPDVVRPTPSYRQPYSFGSSSRSYSGSPSMPQAQHGSSAYGNGYTGSRYTAPPQPRYSAAPQSHYNGGGSSPARSGGGHYSSGGTGRRGR